LNDAFFSIVSKGCARDEVLVRARREGDIEKLFADVKVERATNTDYAFRAVVKRSVVADVLTGEVHRINYGNFKDSVSDTPLHNAYSRVWSTMSSLQATPPYGNRFAFGEAWHDWPDEKKAPKKKRARKLRGKGR
jgi:hypothetical protein